ncbi:hypothetical protein J3E72DRAFT_428230 [Bipolaris maydis]|nr:hypothetical protein J3E74DRAFT_474940 [Bipolaris maydis]KAJ6201542.1 hypothetical protein J3E72DRAFT_428230 [Bipolaris maydis]
MHFTAATIALSLLAAATASPLSPRQGGAFVAVGLKYSGPGCTDSTLINADPIFGNGNVCQPLDRFDTGVPIRSYMAIYQTADCSGTAFLAPVGGCVTGDGPFVSAFVTCA